MTELLDRVEAEFARTAHGLEPWPDPWGAHRRDPEWEVPGEAYSRVTDPDKWRLIGARFEAWIAALVRLGGAEREVVDAPVWAEELNRSYTTVERVVPRAAGAVSFTVGRLEVDAPGVVLAMGDPLVVIEHFPDCGCDACDSGSDAEIEVIDDHVTAVAAGTYRRLTRGDDVVWTLGGGRSGASFRPRRLRRAPHPTTVLADPAGWVELSGSPWVEV